MARRDAHGLCTIDRPAPETIPSDPVAWLRQLGGPTAIRLSGRDRSRCRTVVTLLHGNEPSGVRALHGWLREHVYAPGRTFTPNELVQRATGQEMTAAPYLAYLRGKYTDLYGL